MRSQCSISRKTVWRDKRRPRERVEALQLARELDALVQRFPKFSMTLNRSIRLVRIQGQPSDIKQNLIRDALRRFDILALNEIATETELDPPAIIESLRPMIKRNQVQLCRRDGAPYRAPTGVATDCLGRQINSLNRPGPVPVFFRLVKTG